MAKPSRQRFDERLNEAGVEPPAPRPAFSLSGYSPDQAIKCYAHGVTAIESRRPSTRDKSNRYSALLRLIESGPEALGGTSRHLGKEQDWGSPTPQALLARPC